MTGIGKEKEKVKVKVKGTGTRTGTGAGAGIGVTDMYRDHTVGVVVPAYNEAGFVGEVIETVPSYVDRVYVIDDGSTDETWEEITTAAQRLNEEYDEECDGEREFDRRIVPIQHDANRGVGGAIKTGYLHARSDRIDVTAVMGGDGQMRPEQLQQVIDPIVDGQAAYVKGNRLRWPEAHDGMPLFRFTGNYILSALTKVASGYWEIGDPQNGYTAISLHALDEIAIEDLYEFYGYCNELLVRLNVNNLQVADVPRKCNYADEESHINYTTYIPRVSGMLLSNFLWRLRETYLRDQLRGPGICYTTGTLTGLLGVVLVVLEARAQGLRSRGVGNALKTVCLGAAVFVLGAVLERRQNDRLDTTVEKQSKPKMAASDRSSSTGTDTDTDTDLSTATSLDENGDGNRDRGGDGGYESRGATNREQRGQQGDEVKRSK